MGRFLEMAKKSVGDLGEAELKGKKVLVRCDLNVPLSEGKITDDTRIRGSIPTIEYLSSKGAKVMLSPTWAAPRTDLRTNSLLLLLHLACLSF